MHVHTGPAVARPASAACGPRRDERKARQDLLQVHDPRGKNSAIVRPTTSAAAVTSAIMRRTCRLGRRIAPVVRAPPRSGVSSLWRTAVKLIAIRNGLHTIINRYSTTAHAALVEGNGAMPIVHPSGSGVNDVRRQV
jgi:hypothetical protein